MQIPLPELNSHTLFIGSCLANLDLRKSLPFMVVLEGLECCHSHFWFLISTDTWLLGFITCGENWWLQKVPRVLPHFVCVLILKAEAPLVVKEKRVIGWDLELGTVAAREPRRGDPPQFSWWCDGDEALGCEGETHNGSRGGYLALTR